ncbi:MAG: hypothetical protein J0H68_01600 [Sphingobacteriia bacterium]|nr:hypothetical protein [Sphingobacteriia bacterium]
MKRKANSIDEKFKKKFWGDILRYLVGDYEDEVNLSYVICNVKPLKNLPSYVKVLFSNYSFKYNISNYCPLYENPGSNLFTHLLTQVPLSNFIKILELLKIIGKDQEIIKDVFLYNFLIKPQFDNPHDRFIVAMFFWNLANDDTKYAIIMHEEGEIFKKIFFHAFIKNNEIYMKGIYFSDEAIIKQLVFPFICQKKNNANLMNFLGDRYYEFISSYVSLNIRGSFLETFLRKNIPLELQRNAFLKAFKSMFNNYLMHEWGMYKLKEIWIYALKNLNINKQEVLKDLFMSPEFLEAIKHLHQNKFECYEVSKLFTKDRKEYKTYLINHAIYKQVKMTNIYFRGSKFIYSLWNELDIPIKKLIKKFYKYKFSQEEYQQLDYDSKYFIAALIHTTEKLTENQIEEDLNKVCEKALTSFNYLITIWEFNVEKVQLDTRIDLKEKNKLKQDALEELFTSDELFIVLTYFYTFKNEFKNSETVDKKYKESFDLHSLYEKIFTAIFNIGKHLKNITKVKIRNNIRFINFISKVYISSDCPFLKTFEITDKNELSNREIAEEEFRNILASSQNTDPVPVCMK